MCLSAKRILRCSTPRRYWEMSLSVFGVTDTAERSSVHTGIRPRASSASVGGGIWSWPTSARWCTARPGTIDAAAVAVPLNAVKSGRSTAASSRAL